MIRANLEGDRELQAKLRQLETRLQKTAEDSAKEAAQFAARELGRLSEPFGNPSGNMRAVGEKMIRKDVANSYASNKRIYANLRKTNVRAANMYSKAVRQNDLAKMEEIINQYLPSSDWSGAKQSDSNATHLKTNRNSRGRVRDKNILNLADESEIEQIARDKIKNNTFLAKAAWYQAGQDLGMKTRIPAWMRREKLGRGYITGSGSNVQAILQNSVRYVSNVLSAGKLADALRQAMKNQITYARKQLRELLNR
jgi:hypothetical protein